MNEKPTLINIINFVRGVEPRSPIDLVEPVRGQLALLDQYNMRGTFLLQYDAMLDDRFIGLLKDARHEIGGWLEIVEPLAKAANIPWRGRFPWDWHSDVGFSVGYLPKEREALVDVYMARFKAVWGYYPKSVGSWLMDAHTLAYLHDRYKVVASCNCKDQWGTDGYTLWGGYYGQAYYPSRTNAYMPAQHGAAQIPLPVFKMLGSDPIYQYDMGLSVNGAADAQHVVTLEPVYVRGGGGGNPEWVRWFFDDVLHAPCLSFRYAQVGQENSFGWPAMEKGLRDQFERLCALSEEPNVRIETLAESGAWYRETYPVTPASVLAARTDWKGEDRQSVWFCSAQYRVNLYVEAGKLWIRDLHVFDERYRERYLTDTCKSPLMVYDTLPVVDGNRWSGGGIRAGWYLWAGDRELHLKALALEEKPEALELEVTTDRGDIRITCTARGFGIETGICDFSLHLVWGKSEERADARVDCDLLRLKHAGYDYAVRATAGSLSTDRIDAESGIIALEFS